MTDADVVELIRSSHLKANISDPHIVNKHWDKAWVDPGGTRYFGPGPYVHLPVDMDWGSEQATVTIRVYPPARLRRRLAQRWRQG